MEKQRSPNYPSFSLREAVERVRSLHSQVGQTPHSRDVVARGMGYSSLSGSSASAISAAKKYGLLEGRGEDICVSDRALAILHPHSDRERQEALRAAAAEPEIFRELGGKFPDTRVNDELVRNYLLRNKFTPKVVDGLISAYRETIEFVGGFRGGYDSPPIEGDDEMHDANLPSPVRALPVPAQPVTMIDEVEIGGMGFKGVGFVKIMASPDLSLQKALSMAEQVIKMMRDELAEDDRAAHNPN